MKVSLTTRGGMAAGVNLGLPPKVVDTDDLPQSVASELARLVVAAKTAPPPDDEKAGRARDPQSYMITIEDGGPPVVLTGSDVAMSPGFIALRDWIRKHSTQK